MRRSHWKYLKYVLAHKRRVWVAGREFGVGRLRLLVHDFQKFSPKEWGPYIRRFVLEESYPHAEFEHAWLHHLRVGGKHHWEYWLLLQPDGTVKALEMPEKYVREMLADWTAMGRHFGEEDAPRGWWEKKKDSFIIHPRTRRLVEELIGT